MIKPQDTPDLLVELIRNVNRPVVKDFMEHGVAEGIAIGATIKEADPEKVPMLRGLSIAEASKVAAKSFVGMSTENLHESKLYYCDGDMSNLIESGAKTLDGSDLGDLSLLPSTDGFCYFSKGIRLNDMCTVHAITWRCVFNEFAQLTAYNDYLAEPDHRAIVAKRADYEYGTDLTASRWTFIGQLGYDNERPLNPVFEMTSEQIAKAYETQERVPDFVLSQIFHSFLLMLQQPPEMIEKSTVTPKSSATLKRAKKNSVSSEVVVVDIRHKRKPSGHSTRDSAFEYSVRWIVSGHWRWQWFKDENTGEPVQKRIWINPHLKGPDGKPFKKTKLVNALLK